jgi:hypothetical protein
MHLPGRKHFVAVRHLLHHLRCYPLKAIKYYHDSYNSPLYEHLKENNLKHLDPWFIAVLDLLFADADGQQSTGCNLVLLQGGIVSMGCFVPDPIAQSLAEAKMNAQTITCMKVTYVKQIVMDIIYRQLLRRYTVPLLTNNTASIEMARNGCETKSTKHIKRQWLYVRQCNLQGKITLMYIPSEAQLANLGTKQTVACIANKLLAIVEVNTPDDQAKTCQTEEG